MFYGKNPGRTLQMNIASRTGLEVEGMFLRQVLFCVLVVNLFSSCVSGLRCQTATAPTTYTVSENNAMFGPTMIVKIYRNGSKALVDSRSGPDWTAPKPMHTRAIYDLTTRQTLSWDLNDSSIPCGNSTFSGSW
jgi:hypothetical protein